MYRSIIQDLKKWKDDERRKPLIMTGVRQCGKTYTLKAFGSEHFGDTAYFNFEERPALASIFEYDFDVNRIIDELGSVILGRKITPGQTLVIFDEIQECPRAITSLKYFCENMRELHVACAGSLLGVALKRENISFPVGKTDSMTMRPMTFSEFVRADGGGNMLDGLAKMDIEREIPEIYAVPMAKYLRFYTAVGGMPEAVSQWAGSHDIAAAERIQGAVVSDYEKDFSKHVPTEQISRLRLVWQSVPKQLAKDNHKFIFSHVKTGGRARELEDALQWLSDAGLIHRLELAASPEPPLSFSADASYFKVYTSDIGLLRHLSGTTTQSILNGEYLSSGYRGALTENFVMTELAALGLRPYFWRSGNTAEVDFIVEQDGEIIPIEVKSAENTRAKSLSRFITSYSPHTALKFSLKNIGRNETGQTALWSLPLWMIWRLRDYIKQR